MLADGVVSVEGGQQCHHTIHHHSGMSGVLSTSHRPHIGCQIQVFMGLPLRLGGVAHAVGLQWWTKDSTKLFWYNVLVSFIVSSVSATHVKADKHCNRVSQ